jgi:hypothetical protein
MSVEHRNTYKKNIQQTFRQTTKHTLFVLHMQLFVSLDKRVNKVDSAFLFFIKIKCFIYVRPGAMKISHG